MVHPSVSVYIDLCELDNKREREWASPEMLVTGLDCVWQKCSGTGVVPVLWKDCGRNFVTVEDGRV